MLNHCTQSNQGATFVVPSPEPSLNSGNHEIQFREVAIMQAEAADQLPNPFNGIQVRAVRRQEGQLEISPLLLAPRTMQPCVVIFGIVDNHDDAPPGAAAGLAHLPKKGGGTLGVKLLRLPPG